MIRRILKKDRWVTFDVFETESVSSVFVLPFIGRVVAGPPSFEGLVEVEHDGIIVFKKRVYSDIYSPYTLDLSNYVGLKKVSIKILRSNTNNGIIDSNYPDVILTSIDSRFDLLRYIYVGQSSVINVSSTMGRCMGFIMQGGALENIPASAINLRMLRVYGNAAISTIPSTLTALEELTVIGLNEIVAIPSSLSNLKQITIHGNNGIYDISYLTSIDTRVDIRGSNQLYGSLESILPYYGNVSSAILLWGSDLTYSNTLSFNANLGMLWLDPKNGSDLSLNSQMVSNIIKDFSSSVNVVIGTSLILGGNCATPDMDQGTTDAIMNIIGMGGVVTIN